MSLHRIHTGHEGEHTHYHTISLSAPAPANTNTSSTTRGKKNNNNAKLPVVSVSSDDLPSNSSEGAVVSRPRYIDIHMPHTHASAAMVASSSGPTTLPRLPARRKARYSGSGTPPSTGAVHSRTLIGSLPSSVVTPKVVDFAPILARNAESARAISLQHHQQHRHNLPKLPRSHTHHPQGGELFRRRLHTEPLSLPFPSTSGGQGGWDSSSSEDIMASLRVPEIRGIVVESSRKASRSNAHSNNSASVAGSVGTAPSVARTPATTTAANAGHDTAAASAPHAATGAVVSPAMASGNNAAAKTTAAASESSSSGGYYSAYYNYYMSDPQARMSSYYGWLPYWPTVSAFATTGSGSQQMHPSSASASSSSSYSYTGAVGNALWTAVSWAWPPSWWASPATA